MLFRGLLAEDFATPPGWHFVLSSTRPSAPDLYLCSMATNFLQRSTPPSHLLLPSAHTNHNQRRVIWLDCLARGEEQVKSLCKRLSGKGLDWKEFEESIWVVEPYEALQYGSSGASTSDLEWDERPRGVSGALEALTKRMRAMLQSAQEETRGCTTNAEEARCLVVLDDLNTLAWGLAPVQQSDSLDSTNGASTSRAGAAWALGEQQRALAKTVAAWVEELGALCEQHSAALVTHLHADHTSILDDAHHSVGRNKNASSRGAGQGFDADDAGEEDADLNIAVQVESPSSDSDSGTSSGNESKRRGEGKERKLATTRVRPPIRATFVDAFDDELFLGVLKGADVWVEMRALRSGRAIDCHGEICTHALARPSAAVGQPIPSLPLPSSLDPFRKRRRAWRAARPNFLSSTLSSSSRKDRRDSDQDRDREKSGSKVRAQGLGRALGALSLREKEAEVAQHFIFRSEMMGRSNAALFEIVEVGPKGRGRVEVRLRRRAGSNG